MTRKDAQETFAYQDSRIMKIVESIKELYDCIIEIDRRTGYLNEGYGESEVLRHTKTLIKGLEPDDAD